MNWKRCGRTEVSKKGRKRGGRTERRRKREREKEEGRKV